MTSAYVRICRDGEWQAVEFDQLTDAELQDFAAKMPDDGWKWAKFLAAWIRDNIREDSK